MRMTRPPMPCEERFRKAAPTALYREFLELLNPAYPDAFREVMARFREGAALTLLPHYRRAMIETELQVLAHRLGLSSSVETFPGTTDTFVLIEMPDQVKLIVCYLRNKKDAVRYARAREEMAQQSNQPYLFEDPTSGNLVLPPSALFAILTHCPDEKDVGIFGSAAIIFPHPDPKVSLGELNVQAEAERVQIEEAAQKTAAKRKVEIKIKKGGDLS